tara:strand:- start:327 stop:608 length:282 start_codon:yes stop_codon:yes gene_type:complete
MNISHINIARAQQVLRKYNTTASLIDTEWDIRGELVDNCVYARLVTDKNEKFCLGTASLCWDHEDILEMIEAVTKINNCLAELSEIDPALVKG